MPGIRECAVHAGRVALWVLFPALPLAFPIATSAQTRAPFSIEDVLSPAFPFELIAASSADRIGWIEYERGMRNVWTATTPGFDPVRLTSFTDDDGHDLSGLQLSADGSVLAFLRGHEPNRAGWVANPSSDPRGAERAVWAISSAGGPAWRVVEARAFALSPDGRWVAYAKDGQIYRAPVNPGLDTPARAEDPAPLFRAFGSNAGPVWSPDGRRIAFVSDREDHSFIGVYDTQRPGITYLAPGVDRDQSPTWSPDGRSIAFIRRPGLPFGAQAQRGDTPDSVFPPGMVDSRFAGGHSITIHVADVTTGEGREVWRNTPDDERFAEIRRIQWAGNHIVFEAEPGNWRHWFSIPIDEPQAQPVELTPGEGFVEAVSVSNDGRWLYYATNVGDIDRRDLWRVRTGGGRPEQLTRGDDIEHYPVVLHSGRHVALLFGNASRSLSVAVMDADGDEPRVITALPAAFPLAHHVRPVNATITAEDGLQTNNQLFLPPDLRPGERRPALIFIHGGSRRQMLLGYHYMHFYHMAYALNQYFANRGYVVLSINYRSGIGYGRAFRTAPEVGRNGNAEYRDVIAAGRWLQNRADVDPQRIGVWGLSYGGILTAQALARNSDVFAAGVDIAGVHLWGNSIEPDAVSYRSSSISEIGSWKSPVLLVHADDDRNVSFSQTVGLVQLLRAHDVPHELIVFPDDVHDFLLHRRWLTTFHATDDFFQRTLVRGQPVRPEGTSPFGR
jgi:dipeptidyl aminopeptidase/acylaminoacyl peptidase